MVGPGTPASAARDYLLVQNVGVGLVVVACFVCLPLGSLFLCGKVTLTF
jgi:hypothetical protein